MDPVNHTLLNQILEHAPNFGDPVPSKTGPLTNHRVVMMDMSPDPEDEGFTPIEGGVFVPPLTIEEMKLQFKMKIEKAKENHGTKVVPPAVPDSKAEDYKTLLEYKMSLEAKKMLDDSDMDDATKVIAIDFMKRLWERQQEIKRVEAEQKKLEEFYKLKLPSQPLPGNGQGLNQITPGWKLNQWNDANPYNSPGHIPGLTTWDDNSGLVYPYPYGQPAVPITGTGSGQTQSGTITPSDTYTLSDFRAVVDHSLNAEKLKQIHSLGLISHIH